MATQIPVRQQCAHRAERLDPVHRRGEGVLGAQQDRRQERAALGIRANDLDLRGVAEHRPGDRSEPGDSLAHLLALPEAGQGPQLHARVRGVADDHFGKAGRNRISHGPGEGSGHEGAPDRGALLAGLHGHLGDQPRAVQVELGIIRGDVRPEDRAVQRVRLGVEGDRAAGHDGVRAQGERGGCGAGEGERVLRGQLAEQAPGQVPGQRPEDRRALSEGERTQRRAAHGTRVAEHGRRVRAACRDAGHDLTGRGVQQRALLSGAAAPASLRVTAQGICHRDLRSASSGPPLPGGTARAGGSLASRAVVAIVRSSTRRTFPVAVVG